MKHTPGPWRLYPHGCETSNGLPVIVKKNGHLVASLCDRNTANGRLIAAAPELLAVARGALGYLLALPESERPDEPWLKPLRETIAKAEGKQS